MRRGIRQRMTEVTAIFGKEVRCLIRDNHTIVHSVLIPLFLYPTIVWGVVQVLQYATAVQQKELSRVRLVGAAIPAGLTERLAEDTKITLVLAPDFATPAPHLESELTERARSDIRNDHADLWLVARAELRVATEIEGGGEPTPDADAIAADVGGLAGAPLDNTVHIPNTELVAFYQSSNDASRQARARIDGLVTEFRRQRLENEALRLGRSASFVEPLAIETQDVATPEEMGNWFASLILPLLMVLMTALGAFYPALDVTVGERERSSLETTLVGPADRSAIVLGKFFAVVIFAFLSFSLNFLSMGVTLVHVNTMLQVGSFSLGLPAIGVILLSALLLSFMFSSVMMILAFQARSFKEGQSYLTPVTVLVVIPAFIVATPHLDVTPAILWTPIVNIVILFRLALSGQLTTQVVLVTLLVSIVYVAILLAFTGAYLRRLEVVTATTSRRRRFWPSRRRIRVVGHVEEET